MFKKNRILCLLLVLCVGVFSGCKGTSESNAKASDKYSVVCTIFPEYDWTKEVIGELGEDYELTLLLENNVDLHNYQPTAEDISKIAVCDLFIYVGGESDGWVEDALKEASNPNMQVINLLEVLGEEVKEEEVVEGMEAEHEHEHEKEDAHEKEHEHDGESEHEHEEESEHEHDEEVEYDEHVWLSLRNVEKFVTAITDSLKAVDSENAAIYETNCENYVESLKALDKEYETVVADASQKTLLFGDRFPFRYLTDDYGLDYYAAFVGCSAETEASFETIIFLAGKMDELDLKHILIIENSEQKIAQTIIENTTAKNQDILVLHSLQSISNEDIAKGMSYLSVMQDNLEILKTALN